MIYINDFNEFQNLSVSGQMLNVGDGDAILLTLKKEDKTLFVVVDGGDSAYATKVLESVKLKCVELQKDGPDLVICTHYDSDHIAGLIAIAQHFGDKIKKFWIHRPPDIIEKNYHLITEILQQSPGSKLLSEAAKFIANMRLMQNDPNDRFAFLLESIRQVKDLFAIIKKRNIPTDEPFANECILSGWPEIKILGPTRSFFEQLFSKKSFNEFLAAEHTTYLQERAQTSKPKVDDPCSLLKTNPITSAINMASVIFRIDRGSDKFLFTGDAGVQSFNAVDGFPKSIQNMTFLKIPHHGSNNNMTKELIDQINPDYAFNSGNGYENSEVMGCIKNRKDRIVKTTRDGEDLLFRF